MNNCEILQESIDYIENNLKTEILAEELADIAGFSLFHYYKIFQNTVGMPVMQYVTRRKLLNAIYEISNGKKIIDVALSYGFETHGGFYKAFKREFYLSPSDYIKKHKAKKPYKINLFREEHIMITHKKVLETLKKWNMENEKITNYYYEGTDNRNDNVFYVGDNYVLKFTANLGTLKNHIEISKVLENVGIKSAVPVKTITGDEFVQEGELYASLTKRIKGSQIKSSDIFEGDYTSKSRFIGEILGQLHLILAKFDVAVNDNDLLSNIKNWALPKTKEIINLDGNILDNFMTELERLYPTLPKQIVHRDPNPANIVVDGESFGFVDFDLSEKNVRIYDPCYTSTAILSETINEFDDGELEKWIDIYKNIVYGYDSVAKLSDKEKEAMPYIIIANQLVCVAWLSEQEKYKKIFESNIKMTNWIFNNFEKLKI